jgi:hypothetical protein
MRFSTLKTRRHLHRALAPSFRRSVTSELSMPGMVKLVGTARPSAVAEKAENGRAVITAKTRPDWSRPHSLRQEAGDHGTDVRGSVLRGGRMPHNLRQLAARDIVGNTIGRQQ